MNTKKSSARSTWKYLSILPLFLISLSTINAVEEETILEDPTPIEVVQSSDSIIESSLDRKEMDTAVEEELMVEEEEPSKTKSSHRVTQDHVDVLSANRNSNNEEEFFDTIEKGDGFIEDIRTDENDSKPDSDVEDLLLKVFPGEWKGKIKGDELCFEMNASDESKGWNSYYSTCVPINEFTLDASKDNPDWILKRDAGTLTLEGTFNGKRGSGEFDFEPNQSFVSYLKGEGIPMNKEMDMFHLFMNDMNQSYVGHLKNSGFKLSKDGLIALSVHGIEREKLDEYIVVFEDLGKQNIDLEDIVQYEIHGVGSDYVKEMKSLNLDIDADNIVQARIHGVDPGFVKELNDLGYNDMDMDNVVQFAIHGVDAELVHELDKAGYENIPPNDIVQFAIHGISPSYIRKLEELELRGLGTDEIIQFAIHGIDLDDVRTYTREGYKDISANDIVQMGIHGVDGRYVKELKTLNIDNLSVQDIVQFSIHGVDVSEVKDFMTVGYDLDANQIIQMSIHGVDPSLARELEKQGFKNLDTDDLVQASIHGVDTDYVSEIRDLGVEIDDFDEVIQANIHGVSPRFIEKAQNKGYNLKTLKQYIKVKIHGFD